MTRGTVFCLFALLAIASAASISGSANLSGNSVSEINLTLMVQIIFHVFN